MPRIFPNIVVTGTPCVGKTTTCSQLVALVSELPPAASSSSSSSFSADVGDVVGSGSLRLRHLAVNQLVRDKGCHEGWDEGVQSWVVDEERLVDELENEVVGLAEDDGGDGGWLIDWHACDLFPQRWVDLVVVLRCGSTEVMWDRLKARGYAEAKLQENLDAEIFGVLLEEAKEAFDEEIVVELKSETAEDVDQNCERILQWIQTWRENRKKKVAEEEG